MKDVNINTQKNKRPRVKRTFPSIVSIIICGFGIMVLASAAWSLSKTLIAKEEAVQHLEIAKLEYQQAVEKNREVQQELQLVNDPEYLAQIARRDYYYSKPGEIIFNIEEDLTQKTQQEDNN